MACIRSTHRIPTYDQPVTALYRGWMLQKKSYALLESALREKKIYLLQPLEQYLETHYLPYAYPKLEGMTPKTNWFPCTPESFPAENVQESLKMFGSKSVMIKDYVKSRKQDWEKACFIPDASDLEHAFKIVQNFLLLQGEQFQEGFVFREVVPLEWIGNHSVSRSPIYQEFRIFYYQHQRICAKPYWGQLTQDKVPYEIFDEIAKKFSSCFFTMDVAKLQDGSWTILEVGDGQVSDLPPNEIPIEFYDRILKISQNA